MPDESEIKVSNKGHSPEAKVSKGQSSEPKISKVQSSDMLKSLDGLVDEALQICEFNNEEENTVVEISETIGMMLMQLKTYVKITPTLLGPGDSIKRAVLGQDGQIMITYNDDQVAYKKLTDFHSSMIMEILNDVFMKLRNASTEYRKTLEDRLSVYRAANKKLKKIDQVLKAEEKVSTDDAMQESLEPDLAKKLR
ncbi:MAG: hypothetical protein ACRD38_00790 [Nitrososphaerales archaeon]